MNKTILITGSTDGIGLEAAKMLVAKGHHVLLHGRNPAKLKAVHKTLTALPGAGKIEGYAADLSRIAEVETLSKAIIEKHQKIDILINNAGVYSVTDPLAENGLDVRFVVNVLAPYVLTEKLMPLLGPDGRIVNLSSAAQSPVDLDALAGKRQLPEQQAYAQSKLALTMWSRHLADRLGSNGPMVVAVNPGSLLATNMVRDAYGISGNDIGIGADILTRAALSDEFADANGKYFDNDSGRFANPHPDAMDSSKCARVVRQIETLIATG